VQVVASAGNSGGSSTTQAGAIAGVLLVTSVGADDVKADFACFGQTVDLAAPGVDLSGSYPEDPGTAIWSGTSFSAAIASGGIALLKELHPTWDVSAVADRLLSTSVAIDDLNEGYEGHLGAGRIDLDAATE
jgi:subtilisin family serine protease